MRWPEAHRSAMLAAAEAHEELAIDTFQRVDVFGAMCSAGLKVTFEPLKDCAALYLPAAFGGRPGAIINSSHPLALQRYSAGHEVGHHVYGHGRQVIREAPPDSAGAPASEEEMLAEAFAAWFLMAPEGVAQALAALGLSAPRTALDVYALSLRLGTSYQATTVHLPSLKLLSHTTAGQWRGLAPKALKQQLSAEPPPGGWRNDIWVIGPGDLERPVLARAGDRLLLELPGLELDALPDGASARELPAADLFATAVGQVDLAAAMDAGPAPLGLHGEGRRVELALSVERPLHGRFVAGPVRCA